MNIAVVIARILMGVIVVFFGLNGFLQFLKAPLPTGLAGQFLMALFQSHYVWFICAVQIVGGGVAAGEPICAAGVSVAGTGDREYYFVSPAFKSGGGAVGGGGDNSVVLSLLSLSAELFRIVRAEGYLSPKNSTLPDQAR